MKGKWIMRLAAVGLGIAIFLMSAEIGSRMVFSRVMNFDQEMWKYTKRVKIRGKTPGIRFEHRPLVKERLMGVELRTNASGMRGREYSADVRDEVVRIAVLGDSIALGWGVDEDRTFAAVLEDYLDSSSPVKGVRRFEVLNFGIGNYNIGDQYRLLIDRVFDFHPQVVLVSSFLNDAEPDDTGAGNFLLRHSSFAVWMWGRLGELLRRAGYRPDFEDYYRSLYEPASGGWQRVEDGVSRIAEACAERGVKVIAVMIPELNQTTDYPFADIHERFGAIYRSHGIPFLDLSDSVAGFDPSDFRVSRDDAHPNAKAHERFAASILSGFDWEDSIGQKESH